MLAPPAGRGVCYCDGYLTPDLWRIQYPTVCLISGPEFLDMQYAHTAHHYGLISIKIKYNPRTAKIPNNPKQIVSIVILNSLDDVSTLIITKSTPLYTMWLSECFSSVNVRFNSILNAYWRKVFELRKKSYLIFIIYVYVRRKKHPRHEDIRSARYWILAIYCMSKKSCPFACREYTMKIGQGLLDLL